MGLCCGEDLPVLGSSAQTKAGYVLKYKDGLFSSAWEEVWLVLWGDGLLAWYTDQRGAEIRGGIRLGDSPDLIAAGQHTGRVPGRPSLPPGVTISQMLAVGRRPKNDVFWFATKSEKEVEDWMAAIVTTLPPPPQYQQQQQQAPPRGYPQPPRPAYPQQPGGPPQYRGRPPPGGPQHVTVIPGGPGHYHRGRRDSGPGFGTGLLAGGLMGWGLGGGWGWGGGWGGGWGHGGGYFNDHTETNTTNIINNEEVNNYYGGEGGNLPGMAEEPGFFDGGGEMDFGGGGDFDIGDFGDF